MSGEVAELLRDIRDELRAQNRLLASHSKATLSISAAARLVGIDRKDLAKAVEAGTVRSVPMGARKKIPRDEVERLARVGLPKPEPTPRRRRKPQSPRSVADAIRALPIPSK